MSKPDYSLNSYIGAANYGTLSGTITSTSNIINVSGTGAGWGNLGEVGGFYLSLNYGNSGEEKVYCPSGIYPWGNPIVTITGVLRGQDDTTAVNQQNGYSVVHVFTANDLREANELVNQTLYYAPTASGQAVISDGVGLTFGEVGGSSTYCTYSAVLVIQVGPELVASNQQTNDPIGLSNSFVGCSTSVPLLMVSGSICTIDFFGVNNIDTTNDSFTLDGAILISDLTCTNTIQVVASYLVPISGPHQSGAIDWSTATIETTAGTDLSWDGSSNIISDAGGIYVIQFVYAWGYN